MSGAFKTCGLFALPDDIWVIVLTGGYLVLREIAMFDTAISDRKIRKWFLDLISSVKCQFLRERPLLPNMEFDLTRSSIYGPLTAASSNWVRLKAMHLATFFLRSDRVDRLWLLRLVQHGGRIGLLDRVEEINIDQEALYLLDGIIQRCYKTLKRIDVTLHIYVQTTANDKLNYRSYTECLQNCTQLEAYSAVGLESENVMATLERQNPKIRQLKFAEHSSESIILRMCSGNRGVVSLTLDGCYHINDTSLGQIASHLPGLLSISFAEVIFITNDGITEFVKKCRGLERIILSYSSSICNETMSAIASNCAELEYIDVTNCKKVTVEGLWPLAKQCLKLKKVVQSTISLNSSFLNPRLNSSEPDWWTPLYLDLVMPANHRTETNWWSRMSR